MKKEKLINDIIRTQNVIRKKYQALKRGRVDLEMDLEETFKPLTKKLKNVAVKREVKEEEMGVKEEEEEEDETFLNSIITPKRPVSQTKHELKTKGLNFSLTEDDFNNPPSPQNKSKLFQYYIMYQQANRDIAYGPKLKNDQWKIGDSVIEMENENEINVKNKIYSLTDGLGALLFLKKPEGYSAEDLENYNKIILSTHAHKVNNTPVGRINGNAGYKYKNFILPLLSAKKEGRGLRMQLPKENIDYTYWNDPNELVDRLRLLIASQAAGNTSHNNEIVSIIEELREDGIIA